VTTVTPVVTGASVQELSLHEVIVATVVDEAVTTVVEPSAALVVAAEPEAGEAVEVGATDEPSSAVNGQ